MSSRRKASTKSRHDRSVPDSCSSQHNDVAPKVEFAVHSVDPEEADAYWAARGEVKPPRPSDAPRIVDPGKDDVIMAETDVKMFEADQRGLFSQFEVREFCNNLVEGVVKALKDVSKIQKKSTTTRAPVAEPSLIISEKPKGKSENNLEDLKDFSDSLPIFDEYDEELIENLMICEDNCKLPFQNLILCLMMKKLMD
ncbi:hypothetical protein F2Q70_00035776 [Brassica cretica]|uniref:Uncharacterized protein n=1 Tax=Brassica cretica TaxID=69181 RepID=A0A8S9JRF2_BRACR|nr:hypothetical protein F2Q70_00035776 [Brassica cretica]